LKTFRPNLEFPKKFQNAVFKETIPMTQTVQGSPQTKSTSQAREGKSKILTPLTGEPGLYEVTFKDAATAFNGQKFSEIPGKGRMTSTISTHLFTLLHHFGIPTCWVKQGPGENQCIYRHLEMMPLEVVVRNTALGSLCKRFNLEQDQALKQPLVEFFLKDDAANDPQIVEEMIHELGLLPKGVSLKRMKEMALKLNEIFVAYFQAAGITCADFKVEFGIDAHGQMMLGDELSPDNFRLRDAKTGEVLDKDVFRLELAELVPTYEKLLARIAAIQPEKLDFGTPKTYQASVWVNSRKNVLSPESKTILDAIHAFGHQEVTHLQAGKQFQLVIQSPNQVEAEATLQKLSDTLLSNPVIEDVHWHISGGVISSPDEQGVI
jgi:phosphoribosylaminoimidazole-succinocarboxamide synthase